MDEYDAGIIESAEKWADSHREEEIHHDPGALRIFKAVQAKQASRCPSSVHRIRAVLESRFTSGVNGDYEKTAYEIDVILREGEPGRQ